MKVIGILSRVFYLCSAVLGGYLLAEGVPEVPTRIALIVIIIFSIITWSLPLYMQRTALLELSKRGYSVTRRPEWPLDSWSADKPGYGTTGHHSVHDLLAAAKDYDYRREIIEEHERHKA